VRIPKPPKRGPKPRKAIKRGKLAKKPRHSRKKAVLYADSLWSQIVRRREGGCVSNRPTHAGGFQAAHGFSRRYHATRWNLRNGFKLCQGCHVFFTHRPLEWEDFLLEALGELGYIGLRCNALANERQDLPQITAALEAVLHTGSE